jgi:hypothetical protein
MAPVYASIGSPTATASTKQATAATKPCHVMGICIVEPTEPEEPDKA